MKSHNELKKELQNAILASGSVFIVCNTEPRYSPVMMVLDVLPSDAQGHTGEALKWILSLIKLKHELEQKPRYVIRACMEDWSLERIIKEIY